MDKKDPTPLSAEDIKAIGEIEIGPSKHEIFLNNHYKKLLLGLVVVAVAGAGIIGFYSFDEQQKESAGGRLIDAIQLKSVNDELQAKNYSDATIAEIKTSFADTPAAQSAELLTALALLDKNEVEKAIPALEQVAQSVQDITLRSRAAAAIAMHYTVEGDEKAVAAWKNVVNMEDNIYTGFALISLGDLAQLAGDKEAARQYYTQAKTRAASSAFVQLNDVERRLALLDVDAPKPVVPPAPVIPSINTDVNTELNIELDTDLDPNITLDGPMDVTPMLPAQ